LAKKIARKEKGPKDDGTRWMVVRNLVPVYEGSGLTRAEAERLAASLVKPAEIVEVNQ
jgi:hypothetical protein